MWPFSQRGSRLDAEDSKPIKTADFNFALYATNDAYIKLWLSDKLTYSLDRLGIQHGVSRPDVLRWILFEHVYGRELFADLVQYKTALDAAKVEIRFSRKEVPQTERAINQQYLGKATENIKLWLPMPLKTDLATLAAYSEQPLSNYLRAILVGHLFGQEFFRQWQDALETLNQEAQVQEQQN
jgi:hypothetical protein